MTELDLGRIKTRRKEMRINQQEMAETLGFKNASTYCKYENGDYNFEANHVPAIANKLRLKLTEMFF